MSIPPPPKRDKPNAKLAALSALTEQAPQPKAKPKPVRAITAADTANLKPLNFKVPAEFKRRFKMYALEQDSSMVEIMMNTINQLMDGD